MTALMMLDEHRVIGAAGFQRMPLFVLDLRDLKTADLGMVNPQREMC